MEFLKVSRKKTIISEILYVLLNILMAIAILVVVLTVQTPLPAFLLVLLSKWRVFAVRPQHWIANIISNVIDTIVSLSYVILLYVANGSLGIQIFLTLLYIGWLLILKPRSSQKAASIQAGVGQFVGITALMHVSYDWWATPVVVLMWIIGYSTARHILVSYREPNFKLISLIWALIVAELGWLFYHWNFAYSFDISGNILLSQAAIVVGLLGFMAEKYYESFHKFGKAKRNEVLLPTILVISMIVVSLTIFGRIEGL
ncbi:hypothetical protein KC952_02450 [Candidatus Saccharibacteria bacterium]|nr:hypothetical protein [Candidatus Saccharibacteria bacterium]